MLATWTGPSLVLAGALAGALASGAAPAAQAEDEVVGWIGERAVRLSDISDYALAEWGSQQTGQAAREHLIQIAIVEVEAARRGIAVRDEEVDRQVAFLRESVSQNSGGALSLEDQLAAQGIDLKRFRVTLRQAIACTQMIRADFGLSDDRPVPGDKQNLWYNEMRIRLEVRMDGLPAGEAARVADRVVTTQEWGETLYRSLSEEARGRLLQDLASIELLLEAAKAEGIEITSDDIDEELAARDEALREQLEKAGQKTEGVSYLQVLRASGKDPQEHFESEKFRANLLQRKLARHWYGTDAFRAYYEERREDFDQRYGRRTEVGSVFLRAAERASEEVPRDFAAALEELDGHRRRLDEAQTEAGGAEERQRHFESLARIYSEHSSRERGGVLGALTEAQLDLLGLPTALMDAAPLSMHGPYQVSRGAHLVLVLRHHTARNFDDLDTSELEQHARRTVTERVREGVRIEHKN